MLKKCTLAFTAILIFVSASFAAMPYAPEKTFIINIGPKNATLLTDKYPDLEFFYLPDLKWADGKASGEPKLVADWLNASLRPDMAYVTDKSGNVSFVGYLVETKPIDEAFGQGDLDSLKNVLVNVVENNRNTPHASNKPYDYKDLSGILGHKFPDFEIVDSKGQKTTTKQLLYSDNKPKMLMFSYIPADFKFTDKENPFADTQNIAQLFGAIGNNAVSDDHTLLFDKIEIELYGK